MNHLLQRLLPERLRVRPVLKAEARLRLFGSVSDNDPCLRAVIDLIEDVLEENSKAAFNRAADERTQQQAWMHVGFCHQFLQTIESERAAGAKLNQGQK